MFTGRIAKIPLGGRGFNAGKNPVNIPSESLITAEGVVYELDIVEKEPGTVKLNQSVIGSGSTKIIAIREHLTTSADQRVFMMGSDGKLYRMHVDGSNVTHITGTDATVTRPPFLLSGGAELAGRDRLLFQYVPEGCRVVAAGGGTIAVITGPPADWSAPNGPTWGVIHKNAHWGGGNLNDPHRIYKSLSGNHQDFTTTPYNISIYPGEFDGLMGAVSFNSRLFMFKKPRGIYWLDDSDSDSSKWSINRLVDSVGLISPWAVTIMDDGDVAFMAFDGLMYRLSTVIQFGDVKPKSMMEEDHIDDWLSLEAIIEKTRLPWAQMQWHPRKRKLIGVLSRITSTTNDLRIELDLRKETAKFGYSYRDVSECIGMVRQGGQNSDNIYVFGSNDGNVYLGDQDARSAANVVGGAYPMKAQIHNTDMSWLDAGYAEVRKRYRWLRVTFPTGATAATLLADVYLDYVLKYTLTITVVVGTTEVIKKLRGKSKRISVLFRNAINNQNVRLAEVAIWFKPISKRARKRVFV